MIKFFRKIRQRLLTENKFSKYLLYAVGEIILVVIGILIALSINNWNEERKERNRLFNVYSLIAVDLSNDIKSINEILLFYSTKKELYPKVLSDSLTKEDYQENDTLMSLIISYPDFKITTRGFELLKDFEDSRQFGTDTLDNQIVNLYTHFKNEVEVDVDLLSVDSQDNIYYWKNNCDWWEGYFNNNPEGFIEYAVSSQDYQNRVTSNYVAHYVVYLPNLLNFQEEAKSVLRNIEATLELK